MKQAVYMVFKGLAWIIFAVVLIQFFFAGVGSFGEEMWGDSAFNPHRIAGLLLVPTSLLLLILGIISALTGGISGRVAWMAALLFLLMVAQAALVIAFYHAMDIPLLAALHPVNALILLGLSFGLAHRSQIRSASDAGPSRVR